MNRIITLCLLIIFTSCEKEPVSILKQSQNFHGWLDANVSKFGKCNPKFKNGNYILCDNTKISKKDLLVLFNLEPESLVETIRGRGVKVEIYCHKSLTGIFQKDCLADMSKRPGFQKNSGLHGQYKPLINTILLRTHANKGSLIHEYIHHLQYRNEEEIYGRRYKFERVVIEGLLIGAMDRIITDVKKLKAKVDDDKVKQSYIDEMLIYAKELQRFSKIQDLLDERNIFQLYLRFGNEFGVGTDDLVLAEKNMGFICKNKKLINFLPKNNCPSY